MRERCAVRFELGGICDTVASNGLDHTIIRIDHAQLIAPLERAL